MNNNIQETFYKTRIAGQLAANTLDEVSKIITPGIRMLGDRVSDQKRVMTPKQAFLNGATSIVIGRSITRGNIKNNIQKLIKSLR